MSNKQTAREAKLKFYETMFEQLLINSCDIDQQDNEGKTALHLAVAFDNESAFRELLKNGADIDITDKKGETAFAYCCEIKKSCLELMCEKHYYINRKFAVIFVRHVYKLEFCKLRVNEQNKLLRAITLKTLKPMNQEAIDCFHDEMDKSKSVKIGNTSLSLYEFLTHEDVETVYRNMTNEERREVEQFCANIAKRSFREINCLVKLKYRKSIERQKLLEPAATALNVLANYQLPELVSRYIIKFLLNGDLKRMIASLE